MHGILELTIEQTPKIYEDIEPCLRPWYIAYSRPRQEHIAKASLEGQGIECWYPIRKAVWTKPARSLPSKTRHRRRFEPVEKIEPVFTGYLFIRRMDGGSFDLGIIHELAGVGGMCRVGLNYAEVSDFEIEMLRLAEFDGRFNTYHETVPITYRLSMNIDPRSQWAGQSRLIKRLDKPGKSIQFREEFGRVLRFIQSVQRPAAH